MAQAVTPSGATPIQAACSQKANSAQVGLHLTPRCGEPVWLTSPGSYCVIAKDHVVGMRVLKNGGAR